MFALWGLGSRPIAFGTILLTEIGSNLIVGFSQPSDLVSTSLVVSWGGGSILPLLQGNPNTCSLPCRPGLTCRENLYGAL